MPDPSDLTPAQEAEVRRLLADARHTEPMPAPVADRLDRVLADLTSEPAQPAPVVRLGERRRRAAGLLVAAAAVVVGGVAVGEYLGDGQGGGADQGSAPTSETQAGASEDRTGRDGGSRSAFKDSPVVRVRPDRFSRDVRELRGALTAAQAYRGGVLAEDAPEGATPLCTPGDWGRGAYRAVRYGRSVGFLVFRRPQGSTQVADLFLCGSEVAVRSVTLPSR